MHHTPETGQYLVDLAAAPDALVFALSDFPAGALIHQEIGGTIETLLSWDGIDQPVLAEIMPGGEVWVAESNVPELVRVDGRTGLRLGVVPTGFLVTALLGLPDGSALVVNAITGEMCQLTADGAVVRRLGSLSAGTWPTLSLGPCP